MPYRKENEQGEPIGFDWGRLGARILFFFALGVGVSGVIIWTTYEGPCKEEVLDNYNGGVCDHSDHHLEVIEAKSGHSTSTCQCRKKVGSKERAAIHDRARMEAALEMLRFIETGRMNSPEELQEDVPNVINLKEVDIPGPPGPPWDEPTP